MTDDKQTEQPANENERRSEDELWKEFLSVSFYNMLRPVAGLAILVQPIPADQTEGSTKSDNPFDLAHYILKTTTFGTVAARCMPPIPSVSLRGRERSTARSLRHVSAGQTEKASVWSPTYGKRNWKKERRPAQCT